MTTELLLMDDIPNLGKTGETVKVKAGYARNFLLPKRLAAPVTQASLRKLEKIRAEREALLKQQRAEAQDKANRIKNISVTLRARTIDNSSDPGAQLYGSVTAQDIADCIASQGVAIDKAQVLLEEHIKVLGNFDVTLKLHADVQPKVKVWVIAE